MSTKMVQQIALRGPMGDVDSYLHHLQQSLPESMTFRLVGEPLELGYCGFITKRRIVKQRFELGGTQRQLDIYAEAIAKDWG